MWQRKTVRSGSGSIGTDTIGGVNSIGFGWEWLLKQGIRVRGHPAIRIAEAIDLMIDGSMTEKNNSLTFNHQSIATLFCSSVILVILGVLHLAGVPLHPRLDWW